MYIEKKSNYFSISIEQTYTKFINKNQWEDALASDKNQAEKLEDFFLRYHKGPQELKMAIDNVTLKYFPTLLQCCLESLVFLSKPNNPKYSYYIDQILGSTTFENLFSKELQIMNTKPNQEDQKFINYFLKVVRNSLELQLQQLPKYVKILKETVSNLEKRNSKFNEVLKDIQNLYDQLTNPQQSSSSNYQQKPQSVVNQGTNQQQTEYRPRNFQQEFLTDPRNYNLNLPQAQSYQNNQPYVQQQQFVQIQPTTNNTQANLYQPRQNFPNNNQKIEPDQFQQPFYGNIIQNSRINDNNINSSGFQTLQLNSQSQAPQNHCPPIQISRQQYYQQNQQVPQQSEQSSQITYQSFQNQQTQQNQYPPPQQQISKNQNTPQQSDQYYYKQQNQPEYLDYYQQKQKKQQEQLWVEKPQVSQSKSEISRYQGNQNRYQQQYREYNDPQYEQNDVQLYEVKQSNAPQYEAKQQNVSQYEGKQYNALLYEAKQQNVSQYEAKQYNEQQYEVKQQNVSQYEAKQYNGPQYEVKQQNVSQYEAKQYNPQQYDDRKYNARQYEVKQRDGSLYEVKQSTQYSKSQSSSQQEYRSSKQGYQNKSVNFEYYKYDIEYFNQMKNFYQQKQSRQGQNRTNQTEQVYVSYKDCSIEPIIVEFEVVPNKNFVYGGCIFEIPIGQPFKSKELFLNNHFFILREDYLKGFRNVVARLKENHFEELSYQVLQNAFLYYNVLIENITVTNRGLQFAVTMNAYDPKNNSINWVKTTRLMSGSLILLSTTKLEFMLFGTVVEKPQADRNGRVIILLTLIGLSIKEQLKFVNSLLSQEQNLIAIENKTYFETYTHFLNCLQMIEPSRFPFAEQIVFGSKVMPRPGYLDNQQVKNEGIFYDIDLKFDLHQQKRIGQMQRINILREWPNVNTESLDESQLQAIKTILKNGISLIQGPPGTGKTFCGALGVRILLENQYKWNQSYHQQNKPILIVCQTNHALDQFLSHILTFCRMEDIVRIGGRCKVKEFEPMLLTSNQQERKIHFNWREFLDLRQDLDRKLRNLLNLTDNVNYIDFEQYMPDLLDRVVSQYLEIEDLNFDKPVSSDSRKLIMHMWLDNFKPQVEQANKIIGIEEQCFNYLLKKQANKKKFKPILVYKYSDLDHQFKLSDEAQQQLDQDSDEEFLDENQNIDSDEEENRKVLTTSEQSGKDEFVRKLIQDSRTMKRLVNRLSHENEVSFNVILKEINEKQNYQIWEMSQTKRNVITRYIFSQKFQYLFQILQNEVDKYENYVNQLKQAYIDRDMKFIQTKRIVGVTLSGCAKYAEKLQNLKFNILIVEEAGEVLESNLVAVLSQQINHLILIGDHQQLKPHLECYDLEVKFRANISLFERLIKNGLEYATLKYQRRMKSKFADFIRLIYTDYKDHSSIEEQNKIHIEGFNSDLLFFDHRKREDIKLYSSSKQNSFEARMIVKMVDYLLKNGHNSSKITILTTYVRQALYIQKECGNRNIKVQSIDNYQGEENDIILISLVRSNDDYKLGFVAIDNRVCVALSRARLGLYVFGDFDFIEECIKDHLKKDPLKRTPDVTDLWLRIIKLAEQKEVIKNYIELRCSSHNQITKIYDVKDWDQVKGGGCQNICGVEFPCGHTCQLRCHKSDHNQNDCPELCEKNLTCGHQCLGRCKQYPCPPCRTMIQIQIQQCGHTTSIQCCDQHKKIQCRERCNKILKCGHQCSLQCIDDCKYNKCCEQIQYTLPLCKHVMSIRCDDQNYLEKLVCQRDCKTQLICGHQCSGSCGVCFEKFHYPCQKTCDKILLCGHKCKQLCSMECYKCEDNCQVECNCNIQCKKKCNQICNPCNKDCKLSCQHTECTKKCHEICDRKPCNQKCDKKLKCGCDCMGFCGEVCPEICQNQDHDTQFADKDTIYYQLECYQCNFIGEAEFLDQYFDSQQSNLIHCPKCNQIIWRSRRYQSQVKNSLIQFNTEKEQVLLKQQITYDKINQAIKLTEDKIDFIKKINRKDNYSFLDNIMQDLKREMLLYNTRKPQWMPYHYFKCVKKQLRYYEKTVELMSCLNDNQLFNIHKINLINQYLMNEEFRNSYSKSFWWKVTYKMENLLLYQKIIAHYQKTQNQEFQNISYVIEDSNFYLDDGKKQSFEKILNESIGAQQ